MSEWALLGGFKAPCLRLCKCAPQVVKGNKSPTLSSPPSAVMEQVRVPIGVPEPRGLQPAGATEDGGVLWTRSWNSLSPNSNDIHQHIPSFQRSPGRPVPLHLTPALISFLILHTCSPSRLLLAPSFSPLSFAPPSASLLPCLHSPSMWVRKSKPSGGGERGSVTSPSNEQLLCMPPAQTEPKWPTHISHCWALIRQVCEWLAWWLHSELIPRKKKKNTEQKKWCNAQPLVRNRLFLFSLLHKTGTVKRVVVLVPLGV